MAEYKWKRYAKKPYSEEELFNITGSSDGLYGDNLELSYDDSPVAVCESFSLSEAGGNIIVNPTNRVLLLEGDAVQNGGVLSANPYKYAYCKRYLFKVLFGDFWLMNTSAGFPKISIDHTGISDTKAFACRYISSISLKGDYIGEVTSGDRDAYPDKGTQGEYYYEYIVEQGGDTPSPPATATTGRLEQFQNSAGEQIYPRTIIEGIFRQSDSKPLLEILAELLSASGGPEIELPLRIEEGGTGADSAQTALANLIDNADDTYPAGNPYSSIYIPVSVNGVCHKVPITTIQKWTVGDRGSSVSQENTMYSSFIARGIAAGTSDYAAGSTAMTNGTIYLVYE